MRYKMDAADKRMLDREALRNMIQQWNANRLDLFELSEPNENLEFHGVMRFYFQDSGQKIATKCIRVASDATVSDVIETLIEKFRPDMRMLSLGSYSLWETHGPDDERRLEPHEKPLLVQLNWHADDREGRFLLKCLSNNEVPLSTFNEKSDQNFKRKLSKREKKELKKKEKLSRLKSDSNNENRPVAEKLYTELPETSFTRSISNPEAVMRRRRQQKLERKLQQFRSKDGGPDTGGTLKIYGSSLCPDVPYKTLLLSVGDCAAAVVREMLDKYGLSRHDPLQYCIVQVDSADNSEYILEDDECPLAIVMTHPHRSSIMFHVRRRPSDAQPRRRKKKSGGGTGARPGTEPMLVEVTPDGTALENGRRVRVTDIVEVGSGNGTALQLYGPSIQPRHCVVASAEGGGYSVTPLHADAHVYVNGRRSMHTQRLQHGCLLKFGRVSTFRFVDPAQETIMNRNLAQSQHFGSGSIYDRSPTRDNGGTTSPTSLSHQQDLENANEEYRASPVSQYGYDTAPYNNNTLKLDNESLLMSNNDSKEEFDASYNKDKRYKDNYETTFDLEGNVETKSTCSTRSGGSGHDSRAAYGGKPGQEAILPAVLEFPESGQAQFLAAVIAHLDPHAPAFKLAPAYTLYLCARYRASTHYRPELTPTERAHKLTAFLHHVATLIHATVQERSGDSAAQAFWLANASELLHFLKCDRHISSFSTQAQELLPIAVQNAFSNLVSCIQEELSRTLCELTDTAAADATDATARTLQVLVAATVLLRSCRINSALTLQLFFHLFHYINAVCFNKLVTAGVALGAGVARYGGALSARLALLAAWADRQGFELAAENHFVRILQAARLIQGTYRSAEEACAAVGGCFKLNSVQVRALLAPLLPADILEAAVAHARAYADELSRVDGREILLEENVWLVAPLLVPEHGFSAEVVRGVPPGLAEFVAPLQRGGLCRLARAPRASGSWSVYLRGYGPARAPPPPRVHLVQLHKNANGMGLSIVAAKGANQSKLGIYIKSVVPGGAAAADGRLAAGDQLLSVDGHSLIGITQEKAAEYLVRTGPIVTLEVAKQGAVLHGLATLLHQPAYNQRQGGVSGVGGTGRRASERDLPSRLAAEPVKPSKSTPALHHTPGGPGAPQPPPHAAPPGLPVSHPGPNPPQYRIHSPTAHSQTLQPNGGLNNSATWANKSRSSHNLSQNDSFYQNLSAVQAQHTLNDRWSSLRSSSGSARPQSAHFVADQSPDATSLAQANQQINAANARAAKLAEMSEEVNRRQQHQQIQQQQLQQQQHMQQQQLQQQHIQQQQLQLQMHQQQLHYQQLQQQQMQNQQQLQPKKPPLSHQHLGSQQHLSQSQPLVYASQQNMHANQHAHASAQHTQSHMHASQPHMHAGQPHMHASQTLYSPQQQSPQLPQGMHLNLHQYTPSQMNQHGTPQRYDWHPPGPPSPLRTQPPVAPKPNQNARRAEVESDEPYHQQYQHSALHSEDERYVASSSEPPAMSVYPVGAAGAAHGAGVAHNPSDNPWQREERERQAEARRQAVRAMRDAAIAVLVEKGAARSAVENEQLRSLQLDRDFERRATMDRDESGDGEGDVENRGSSPEPEIEHYPEQDHEERERERERERDREREWEREREREREREQNREREREQNREKERMREREREWEREREVRHQQQPPKSILKTNIRAESVLTNGYNHNHTSQIEDRVSEVSAAMSGVSLGAPPPPERGSSFAVMAGRAQYVADPPAPSPAPAAPPATPPLVDMGPPPPQSPVGGGRDKRVSFHERTLTPPPPATSPPPLDTPHAYTHTSKHTTQYVTTHTQSQLSHMQSQHSHTQSQHSHTQSQHLHTQSQHSHALASSPQPTHTQNVPPVSGRPQHPERFIEEAESILSGGASPTTPTASIPHTPGVIGAQEVYRDPRARRLLEQQARAANPAVPEQLSFKEKMKMFALESGEASTPKDKVKISRAQRDIDAVH